MPVRPKPVWISSAMNRMPCCFANAARVCTYSTGAGTNPPSPSSSSMMIAATEPGSTVAARICSSRAASARQQRPPRRPLGAAVAVGIRNPVHLGRERAESLLVRHHLRGERHREIGAAVEAVIEAEDRLPAREVPRHLHRVLHRLGAAVDEEGPLLVRAGREPVEPLGQLDVGLVRRDREADVREPVELGSRTASTTPGCR